MAQKFNRLLHNSSGFQTWNEIFSISIVSEQLLLQRNMLRCKQLQCLGWTGLKEQTAWMKSIWAQQLCHGLHHKIEPKCVCPLQFWNLNLNKRSPMLVFTAQCSISSDDSTESTRKLYDFVWALSLCEIVTYIPIINVLTSKWFNRLCYCQE